MPEITNLPLLSHNVNGYEPPKYRGKGQGESPPEVHHYGLIFHSRKKDMPVQIKSSVGMRKDIREDEFEKTGRLLEGITAGKAEWSMSTQR